jgi:predicted RNase H-like nuclease
MAEAEAWCRNEALRPRPTKADQDRLDAMLCLIVGFRWRFGERDGSMLLGSLDEGYMVFPATAAVRERITEAANRLGVPAQ